MLLFIHGPWDDNDDDDDDDDDGGGDDDDDDALGDVDDSGDEAPRSKKKKPKKKRDVNEAATAANPLGDDRFSSMFTDDRFQVDTESAEFALRHPKPAPPKKAAPGDASYVRRKKKRS